MECRDSRAATPILESLEPRQLLSATEGLPGLAAEPNSPPTVVAPSQLRGLEGRTLAFNGSFSDPDADDTHTALWDFGDGATSDRLQTTHNYADDGVYFATLTVTDSAGNAATGRTRVIVSNLAPMIQGVEPVEPLTEGVAGELVAVASDAPGDTLTYLWQFDDGTSAEGAVVQHTFADDGGYGVTLTVTDDNGAAVSDSFVLNVANTAPTIDTWSGVELLTPGEEARFEITANDPGDDTLTCTWDFGDGSDPVEGFSVVHSFGESMVYEVVVTVADEDGGVTVETFGVDVVAPPQPTSIVFDASAPAVFETNAGDVAMISLTGAGVGEVILSDDPTVDVQMLVLSGTDDRSLLRIDLSPAEGADHIAGDLQLGGVEIDGSLRAFIAPRVDLTGDFTASDFVRVVRLGDATNGVMRLGGTGMNQRVLMNRVTDWSLSSDAEIKHLRVRSWLDTDGQADSVTAPGIDSLMTARGNRDTDGDFQADLLLTGGGCGWQLRQAKIFGDLAGAQWNIQGSLFAFEVDGRVVDSTIRTTFGMAILRMGAAEGSDFLAGVAPTVSRHAASADDFINARASIGYAAITGLADASAEDRLFVDSNVSAPTVGWVRLRNARTNNGGQSFGVFAAGSRRSPGVFGVSCEDTATGESWHWKPDFRSLWRAVVRGANAPGDAFSQGDFVVRIL